MPDLAGLDICFLAGTLGQGGAEQQLFYILRALRASGAHPRLLSLTRGEFWEEKLRELGIPVTWVGRHGSPLARISRILWDLRGRRPDVLQSQHFHTNPYVVAVARALGVREVGAIRCDVLTELRENNPVARYLGLRTPRVIAANSRAAIENATRLGVARSRLRFLPNAVDCDRFRPAQRRDAGPVRVLGVGRLVEQKRFDRFLSVLAAVRRRSRQPVRGLIVGAGPDGPALERQASELGLLPDAIEFRGPVPEMASLYREVDLLLLTSDSEGTPNVVLEALASGLPVVATRVGGVPEVLRHGETGFLLDPGEDDAMVDALVRLVNCRDLRREIGCQGRAWIEGNHAVARLPAHLERLYDSVFVSHV